MPHHYRGKNQKNWTSFFWRRSLTEIKLSKVNKVWLCCSQCYLLISAHLCCGVCDSSLTVRVIEMSWIFYSLSMLFICVLNCYGQSSFYAVLIFLLFYSRFSFHILYNLQLRLRLLFASSVHFLRCVLFTLFVAHLFRYFRLFFSCVSCYSQMFSGVSRFLCPLFSHFC